MVGYALAWFVDSLSGYGLVDQQNSFLGKLLLHVAVFAILIFRCRSALLLYAGVENCLEPYFNHVSSLCCILGKYSQL